MSYTKWVLASVLALSLMILEGTARPADAKKEPLPPPIPQLVAIARVDLQSGSCSGFAAIDDAGRVLVSQCYAEGFVLAAQLPSAPVSLHYNSIRELYIGLANGDIYREDNTTAPLPWTLRYMGNVFVAGTGAGLRDFRAPFAEAAGSLNPARTVVSPNPAAGPSRIEYVTKTGGTIHVRIFDASGRLVRSLEAAHSAPGSYSVTWDGSTDRGSWVPKGVYFAKVRMPDGTEAATKVVVAR